MSALGQKQTYAVQNGMSALPPIATAKADIELIGQTSHSQAKSFFSACEVLELAAIPITGGQVAYFCDDRYTPCSVE